MNHEGDHLLDQCVTAGASAHGCKHGPVEHRGRKQSGERQAHGEAKIGGGVATLLVAAVMISSVSAWIAAIGEAAALFS